MKNPGQPRATLLAAAALIAVTAAIVVATAYHAAEANQPGICSRTQEVQDAILTVLPNVSDCANVSTSDLASITGTLDLSGQEIDTLHHEDLNGLTAVRGGGPVGQRPGPHPAGPVQRNDLPGGDARQRQRTDPAAHQPLGDQPQPDTGSDASNNGIDELHADAFPYPNLRSVDLSDNSIDRLNGDEFDAATRIEEINLENNQLYDVDASWHGAESLQTLKLAGNPGAPYEIPVSLDDLGGAVFQVSIETGSPLPAGSRTIGNQRHPVPRTP